MSKNLANADVQAKLFATEAFHEYQSQGILRQVLQRSTNYRPNVRAKSVTFYKYGRGQMIKYVTGQPFTPTNVSITPIEAILDKWKIDEPVPIVEETLVSFEARQPVVKMIGGAMGRTEDQVVLDALHDEASPLATIAHGGTNFTESKFSDARRRLGDGNVPLNRLVCVVDHYGADFFSHQDVVKSGDFNNRKPLAEGMAEITTYRGCTFIILGARDEGGLYALNTSGTKTSGGVYRKALLFDLDAVGLAVGTLDKLIQSSYQQLIASWLFTAFFVGIGKVVNPNGVAHINYKRDATS